MSIELLKAQDYIQWMHEKARLNALAANAGRRHVYRGQVYWCQFGLNIGSEISKTTPRPAVIVQNHPANIHSANTIVVPITHNERLLPCMVPITPVTDRTGRTILDGQADTSHIVCVSKARLGGLITTLTPSEMKKIDKAIAISLDLLRYHEEESQKYERLKNHVAQVKEERNAAQDQLAEIKRIVEQGGFDEDSQKKLKELLDIK